MRRLKIIAACMVYLFADTIGTMAGGAQSVKAHGVDLAVSYVEGRSLKAGTSQDFWMQGGSIELGTSVWRGLGLALDVTGSHAASIGASGVPLSLVTATFGPRYRWHPGHKVSLYGEGLVGEANGFGSIFPAAGNSQSDANGLAVQLSGGVDFRLTSQCAVRLIDAGWLRTQLPNSTDKVQNTLRLGAGFVLRFGR